MLLVKYCGTTYVANIPRWCIRASPMQANKFFWPQPKAAIHVEKVRALITHNEVSFLGLSQWTTLSSFIAASTQLYLLGVTEAVHLPRQCTLHYVIQFFVRWSHRLVCNKLYDVGRLLLMMIRTWGANMEVEAVVHAGALGKPLLPLVGIEHWGMMTSALDQGCTWALLGHADLRKQ